MKKIRVSSTKAAEINEESGVLASEARLSAERENDPLTGIDWLKAAATLANPCPISSLFSSHGWRVLMAITLQLDIASMKLIRAITKPAGNKAMVACQSSGGRLKVGSPCGTAPTTLPPRLA